MSKLLLAIRFYAKNSGRMDKSTTVYNDSLIAIGYKMDAEKVGNWPIIVTDLTEHKTVKFVFHVVK